MRTLLPVLVMAAAPCAFALEQADLRGLQVTLEEAALEMRIDGVPARIQHVHGADVVRVVRRVEQRWRSEAAPVQRLQRDGWLILTRLREGRSEVLQWREAGAHPQLIFSVIDTTSRLPRPPAEPFALPSSCTWGRVVQGASGERDFAQYSARCRNTPEHAGPVLRNALVAQGWQVSGSARMLEAARRGRRGTLFVLSGTGHGGSWVVWLGHGPAGAAP